MLTQGNVGGEKNAGRNVRSRRIDKESQRSVFLRLELKARAAVSGHVPFSLVVFLPLFTDTLASRQPAGRRGDGEQDESCADLTRDSHFNRRANEDVPLAAGTDDNATEQKTTNKQKKKLTCYHCRVYMLILRRVSQTNINPEFIITVRISKSKLVSEQ